MGLQRSEKCHKGIKRCVSSFRYGHTFRVSFALGKLIFHTLFLSVCLHLTLISAPRRLAKTDSSVNGEPHGALGAEFLNSWVCKLSFPSSLPQPRTPGAPGELARQAIHLLKMSNSRDLLGALERKNIVPVFIFLKSLETCQEILPKCHNLRSFRSTHIPFHLLEGIVFVRRICLKMWAFKLSLSDVFQP